MMVLYPLPDRLTTHVNPSANKHVYDALTPDVVLNAVDSVSGDLVDGRTDGRQLALNSYENRVYQVGIDDAAPLIVKFYRPGRWSDEAIVEEHEFTEALHQAELPVVAPLQATDGRSLFDFAGFRFALYPRRGGRTPDLEDPDQLVWMGRFLGRIHALGRTRSFVQRPTLDIETFGWVSYRYLMSTDFIPQELREAYSSLVEDVLKRVEVGFAHAGQVVHLRLHGDCHPGNILWTDGGPHFVDFDDARMGPAVQDLWMLLSGDRAQMTVQFDEIISGYTEFMDFQPWELHLIEPLRTLRMIHYSAWLARRWDDPTFPMHFPWFAGPRYWEEQILALREQAAIMDEPPLQWM
jgi:Ser/Thr protein kinase RdoA (MazF antagonist)